MVARGRKTVLPVMFAATLLLAALVSAQVLQSQPAPTTQPAAKTAATQPAADSPVAKAVNPHWSADGCLHCHNKPGDRGEPIPPTAVDAICQKCHNGKQAEREPHPIGRMVASLQVTLPTGWPAVNGKLGCITCHDFANHEDQRPSKNTAFVRGYKGDKMTEYCAQCHLQTKEHERFNPHVMVNEQGKAIRNICLSCHKKPFDESDRHVRTGQPELTADPILLCTSCHSLHLEFFSPGHIGARVPADMKAYMSAFEKSSPTGPMTDDHIEAELQAKYQPSLMPLGEGGVVTCSTCHNPHQKGVFSTESILSRGASGLNPRPVNHRLRTGKEVCRACHNM